jgi:putative transposase
MTHEEKSSGLMAVLQPLIENGFDGLGDMLAVAVNFAMELERERHLGAAPYERTPSRTGTANGFKRKNLHTRIGDLPLRIPQVRDSAEPFYPSALERGQRSEKALALTMGEMYVQGVSTRKVRKVMEAMCGWEVSAEQVSRGTSLMDEELAKWRSRPIGCVKALIVDARYEKVRMDGAVVSAAVFTAIGIMEDGRRSVLGTSVGTSEAELHWRKFLESLIDRGMTGVKFVVSDDHQGLKNALRAALPGAAWQRCQTHLQRNAQSYVTKQDLKKDVAADIRAVFNAPSREDADKLLEKAVAKYEGTQSKLAAWMEANIPEGLAVFALQEAMRKRLRTSNMAENLNLQIKRRTRVAGLFPNEGSLLRLVSAICMEISEEWESGKVYLDIKGMKL